MNTRPEEISSIIMEQIIISREVSENEEKRQKAI